MTERHTRGEWHVEPAAPRVDVLAHLPDGSTFRAPIGTPVEAFVCAAGAEARQAMAAIVNGRLRELAYPLRWDASIQPMDISTSDGMRIYQRSLSFLLVVAARELFPAATIVVDHSIPSGGFFCEVHGRPSFSPEELVRLEGHMRDLVEEDAPIDRVELALTEAAAIFRRQGFEDKVRLLGTQPAREKITLYALKGIYDYFYGYMLPSTGYLRAFALRPAADGFLLLFPTRGAPNTLVEPQGMPRLSQVFREHLEWMELMGIEDVAALNDAIGAGRLREIILVAEALHEKRVAELAARIAGRRPTARVVLIAGPSSSGKTTFAKRLAVQLLAAGVRPIAVGLDDYFVDRDRTPLDENGKPDFEALEAVDLPLFNQQLLELLAGEEVLLPEYNFQTGKREPGRKLRLSPDHVILVEGIHGLNPQLVPNLPEEQAFRIYISALTQLNLDYHNRVSTTDTRLLRRIVRDAQFRGYSAYQTISNWELVRRGERRHIYPYQDNADEFVNSALLYELAVLKPFVEPLLLQIKPSQTMEYIEATRLLAFLSWFTAGEPALVPEISILREFIGGSALREFRY